MDIQDFELTNDQANMLQAIGELVELGLSRELSTRLMQAFEDWRNGPWADALNNVSYGTPAEQKFLQTVIIKYLNDWVEARYSIAALQQVIAINELIAQEASDGLSR